MAKDKTPWVLIAVIGLLVYFLMSGGLPSNQDSQADDTPASAACSIKGVDFTPTIREKGKAGTTVSTNYFIITDKIGSVASSSSKTLPTNYNFKVLFGENSSTHYSILKDEATTCQDPMYDSIELAKADTSLNSFYAKNADGSVNGASNAQPMGADDTFETTVTIKAGADTYFGNPDSDCKNIAVVEFDKTYIKAISGDTVAKVPGFFAFSNTSIYDGSAAFEIPKAGDGEEVSFNVMVESTSSDVPSTGVPIVYVYDCDMTIDSDSLEVISGVEDNDLNSIALAAQSKPIYLS